MKYFVYVNDTLLNKKIVVIDGYGNNTNETSRTLCGASN